jgi:16S rRNA (adenine1518-N6/adenine1519-N6)-dimethyltransferase
VVAVEIDPLLVGILRSETLADAASVELVQGDALELDLAALLAEGSWKVVANIPYYITTPLIERLLAIKERLERIVLMVQREVAARLTAAPGSADYSSLSVFVQYHTQPEITARVSRGAFLPPPDVDSAIVRLRVRREPPVTVQDEAFLLQVVRASFQQRRKTLLNALTTLPGVPKEAAGMALERAGIDPARRGETLSLPEFARLADALAAQWEASG